jgi:ribosomal protein S18 acetylase RimI-like enzyme
MSLFNSPRSAGESGAVRRVRFVFWTRIPPLLEEGDIRLRFPKPGDGPFLAAGLENAGLLPQGHLPGSGRLSCPAVLKWIGKTFFFSYIIEVGSKPVGFAGFYNLRTGGSAEMTLVIFDENDRRCGYGSRVVKICTGMLRLHFSIGKLIFRVAPENRSSRRFLQKMGFQEEHMNGAPFIMYSRTNLSGKETMKRPGAS